MDRRNWLDLSRKLVSRYDLDYTIQAIIAAIGKESTAHRAKGIFSSPTYPGSLISTASGSNMNVSVAAGQAHDENGQLITLDPGQNALLVSDPSLPRKSLVVIRYKATGDTNVPKPTDPLTLVPLNFHDDYQLLVRSGTPNASPAYPAAQPGDVIIVGFTIPAAATLASSCTKDTSVSQFALINSGDYDAITGTGPYCTDASIAAALTRLNGNGKRILIGQNETLNATINVTQNDIEFTQKPGVTITKGTAGTGFNVTGTGVRFDKIRFASFTTAAIIFGSAANWGFVTRCRFFACTDGAIDNTTGGNLTSEMNVVEA